MKQIQGMVESMRGPVATVRVVDGPHMRRIAARIRAVDVEPGKQVLLELDDATGYAVIVSVLGPAAA